MTDDERIKHIANHLFLAHAEHRKFENLDGELKLESIDQAYAVQKELICLWKTNGRGTIAGYKIALTSKAIQDLVGVDQPCVAGIFDSTIHSSPAEIQIESFLRLGLEFELAFRIGMDVPSDQNYDGVSICKYIDSVMPAFELIEDRGADYGNLNANSLIADNAWCGGIVLGSASTLWKAMDLATTPVILSYNGEIETSKTGAAMGSPLNSLAWLASLLSHQGRSLKAGQIVMSGSTLATKFAKSGDQAIYTIEGLGSVEVSIV